MRIMAIALLGVIAGLGAARADTVTSGTWQPLNQQLCAAGQPCFAASSPLLLTDGTVMVQEYCSSRWFRLTPDIDGSYVNGTWSELGSLPAGYAPLYYASAVLPDGRVIINGGEYNDTGAGCNPVWTNKGALYDPTTDSWVSVLPPAGWSTIGDAQSVVLTSGLYMLANCCTTQQALLDIPTMTWSATGSNKADVNDEEGWTLLPDSSVLTVDTNNLGDVTHAERYLPDSGGWISAGSTIVKLDDTNANGSGSREMGPQVLRPDGTVFAIGATGFSAIYRPPGNLSHTGRWEPGPTFPNIAGQGQFDVADGPAALLPDGNVLVAASPGVFNSPTHFFEFDGTSLTQVSEPPSAPFEPSFVGHLLLLPTGQVLYTDFSGDVEIYTPSGSPKVPWRPTIEEGPLTVAHGQSYRIYGKLFNGRSQGSAYGDDYQGPTNYPLVRITNLTTGHVFYCRTFNPSSIGVGNAGRVYTNFTVPSNIELGSSRIEVVANGIPSRPVAATVF
ncbi:hypothetical protein GCM10011611_04470 [Aliidongia dinghuensis]|uniref:Galactose oxidase n=1 Tax=Aliidongia dinghuensis TaxID=1867774 RepID=A0A8J2YPT3_9PROT|nr:hypothetical protein [Aliidongia dinghuensis]GGF02062.1 hypothetical protein GCM10011611_04470 [Aliidongia dinghuensis]